MTLSMQWLEKATWTTSNIASTGGYLNPAQTTAFLRIVIDQSVLMQEIRNEFSPNPKFEVPRIMMANRVLRAGVEGQRLADVDRVVPTTGLVTLSTALFRGEVPISDEILEDNIERDRLADTVMQMLAEAVGRDIEEIAIKSDTARLVSEAVVFDQIDGFVKKLQTNLPAANKIDATGITSYETLLGNMIASLPARYRRNYNELRFYTTTKVKDGYQRYLASRVGGLGDTAVVQNLATSLAFRGIPMIDIPMLSGTDTINGGAIDYGTFIFLVHPQNLIAGWHRRVRVEQFRDPREGVTSFIPSLRFDVGIADPNFGVLAYNVALS
jgi:HK97 family phage major capsid protein